MSHDFLKKKMNIKSPNGMAYKKGQEVAHSIVAGFQKAALNLAEYNKRKVAKPVLPNLEVTYSEVFVAPSEKYDYLR